MTLDEALRFMRSEARQAEYAELLRNAYLDTDACAAAERFYQSAEFAAVIELLEGANPAGKRLHEPNWRIADSVILDLGAGTGIASYAFARHGSKLVYALEPDASEHLGRGVIRRIATNLRIEIVAAIGERIPLANDSIDIVYARQVLHHAGDLRRLLEECARVLKPGGVLLACREHVVDDKDQLEAFLRNHPVHKLVGGENAFSLDAYLDATRAAGLTIELVLLPFDSIINAYPAVRTRAELESLPHTLLKRRFKLFGRFISHLPFATGLMRRRLKRQCDPGRLVSFLARKP